jgi:hypothetical protein
MLRSPHRSTGLGSLSRLPLPPNAAPVPYFHPRSSASIRGRAPASPLPHFHSRPQPCRSISPRPPPVLPNTVFTSGHGHDHPLRPSLRSGGWSCRVPAGTGAKPFPGAIPLPFSFPTPCRGPVLAAYRARWGRSCCAGPPCAPCSVRYWPCVFPSPQHVSGHAPSVSADALRSFLASASALTSVASPAFTSHVYLRSSRTRIILAPPPNRH